MAQDPGQAGRPGAGLRRRPGGHRRPAGRAGQALPGGGRRRDQHRGRADRALARPAGRRGSSSRSGRRPPSGSSRRSRPEAGRFAGSIAFVTNIPARSRPARTRSRGVLRPGHRGRRPGRIRQVDRRARGGARPRPALPGHRRDVPGAHLVAARPRGGHPASAAAVAAPAARPEIEVGTDPDAPAIRVDGTDVAARSGPARYPTRSARSRRSRRSARHLIAMQRQIIAGAIAAGARDRGRGPRHRHGGRARRAGQGVPDRQRDGPGATAQRRPGRPTRRTVAVTQGRAGAA